ncbi:MAG: T9SS type A sorting domain-containing protein [Bacteroidota bacterium]
MKITPYYLIYLAAFASTLVPGLLRASGNNKSAGPGKEHILYRASSAFNGESEVRYVPGSATTQSSGTAVSLVKKARIKVTSIPCYPPPAPGIGIGTSTAFCNGGSTVLTAVINPAEVSTFAGGSSGFANGEGTDAKFNDPVDVLVDASDNVYVTDQSNNRIRKITPDGIVSTFAGSGTAVSTDGTGTGAAFNGPCNMAMDSQGNIFVSDAGGNRIRKITSSGVVSTPAGSSSGFTNGTGSGAKFNTPRGLAVDAADNVYVADFGNNCIRKITPAGVVSTFAGSTSGTTGTSNGTGTAARFDGPNSLTFDSFGNLYVADQGNNKIRKITPDALVSNFAGSGTAGFQDATGTAAKFDNPKGLVCDKDDNVYLTDRDNSRIRKITSAGVVSSIAGQSSTGATNGTLTAAKFNQPIGISIDSYGNLYIADYANNRIRKITLPAAVDSYIWSNGVTGQALTVTASGFYNVRAVSGTCTSTAVNPVSVVVTTIPTPTISASGPLNLCGSSTVVLSSSIAIGNLWSTGATTQSITVSSVGSYTVSQIASGCTSLPSSPAVVTVGNTPSVPVISPAGPQFICLGGNGLSLSSTSGGSVTVSSVFGGSTGTSGDGSGTSMGGPRSVVTDAAGNAYVCAYSSHLIRKITPAGIITTFAGSTMGFSNGTGTSAQFSFPSGITIDRAGNLYVADFNNSAIRKITPAGVVSTFAGGTGGYLDATGSSAKFSGLSDIAIDNSDNLYVCETSNKRLRKISPTGIVTTLAGQATGGYLDGQGIAAKFTNPTYLCVDASGNIYVTDDTRIRKVTPSGTVSTLAGGSTDGFADGTGTEALFNNPNGLCADASGNIYLCDFSNYRIRKITPEGVVSTYMGTGTSGLTNGNLSIAKTANIYDITIDAFGTFNFIENQGYLRKIYTDPAAEKYLWSNGDTTQTINVQSSGNYTVQTISAGCTSAVSAAVAITATVPAAPTVSSSGGSVICNGAPVTLTSSSATGNIWSTGATTQSISISDTGHYSVYTAITGCTSAVSAAMAVTAGSVETPTISIIGNTTFCVGESVKLVAPEAEAYIWSNGGTGQNNIVTITGNYTLKVVSASGCTSAASAAVAVTSVKSPYKPTVSASGSLTFCGATNSVTLTSTNGGEVIVSTLAGSGTAAEADGIGTAAQFNGPQNIAADAEGNVYVADFYAHRISKVSPEGVVTTYAGSSSGNVDGPISSAKFFYPTGLAVDAAGNLYVAEAGNHKIRKITPAGIVSTFAGGGGGFANGNGATAKFNSPKGLCFDVTGNLYVADYGNNMVRKISLDGIVSTLAGQQTSGEVDDEGTAAKFSNIYDVAADAAGNVYVAELTNRIRKISPSGTVSTYSGNGNQGVANGPVASATFNTPLGLSMDAADNLYVVDQGNHTIRKITPAGIVSLIAGRSNLSGGYVDGNTSVAQFNYPQDVAVDRFGNIYVVDLNNRVRKVVEFPSATNYLWSNGETTRTLSTNISGSYTVQTISGTCTSEASAAIVVVSNLPAAPPISASRSSVLCPGNSIVLSTTATGTNIWSNGTVAASITVQTYQAGSYSVRNYASGCPSKWSDTIVVSVLPGIPSQPGAITGPATAEKSSTQTYSIRPVSGADSYEWTYAGGGTGATISGTGTTVTVTFAPTATTGVLYVKALSSCGVSNPQYMVVTLTASTSSTTDLNITGNQSISGNYRNITISGTPTVTLSGNLSISGNIIVANGVTFNTNCNVVSGTGSFTLEAGGTLKICNTAGITQSGNTGSIQTSTRSFSIGANYEYNGTSSQVTGSGLPATVRDLILNNGSGLTLSSVTSLTHMLTLTNGNLNTADKLTLVSNSAGTAMVVNVNGTSTGNVTVQRYISPNINAGAGYRHYSSPVRNMPISGFSSVSGGFTPVLNSAYNTAQVPGSVTPFPNIFGYDLNRIHEESDPFSQGWYVPYDVAYTGVGFCVNIPADQTLKVTGSLVTGSTTYGFGGNGVASSGWALAGNPYPSPIDWRLVTKTDVDDAIYVAQSTGQYAGRYASYVNGVSNNGGSPIIACMQGFFVRGRTTSASVLFTNASRLTTYTNPAFNRSQAPDLVRLHISTPGSVGDETTVYFEDGNTESFDAGSDAGKVHAGGLSIYSIGSDGHNLSINGLPAAMAYAAQIRIRLAYSAVATQIHTISAIESNGPWLIFDHYDGRLHDMPYTFSTVSGRFENRLELVKINSLTGIKAFAPKLSMYPNPVTDRLCISMPGQSSLSLNDAAGKTVMQIEMSNTTQIDLSAFSAGIYTLRCTNTSGTSVYKVVKQ